MKHLFALLTAVASVATGDAEAVVGRWSEIDDGIRGRLVVEYRPDFARTGRATVYVELESVDEARAIWSLMHTLRFRVLDPNGKSVPSAPSSEIGETVESPKWVILAPGEITRLRVSDTALVSSRWSDEVPFVFRVVWRLARGKYDYFTLSAALGIFAPDPEEVISTRVWKGRLFLPSIRVPLPSSSSPEKTPNKAPEPTPGSVTPRAAHEFSK